MTAQFGVVPRDGGVEVAVFSTAAEAVEFCTFDAQDSEIGRFVLPSRTGDVFHGFVPDVPIGTRYGLRVHGAFAPQRGHRFNANKLLLDPYALRIDRPFRLHGALFDTGTAASAVDSAPFMPKALVAPPPPTVAPPASADWSGLIVYEMHVRGFTALHPAVPETDRGTFRGLAHPESIDYLRRLGVTAVEILPCAAWVDERHLPPLGLSNYWGYNPVGFMAPDPRLAPGGFEDISAAVSALRQAGIATILDVVFNHSGESDELGPTLSLRGLDNAYYYRLSDGDPSHYVNDAGCGNILAADRPGVVRLVMDALRLWASATGADGFRFDLATTLGRRTSGFDAAAPLLTAIAQDPVLRARVLIAEPWDIGPGGYRLGQFGAPWGEWNDRFRDTARRFWRGDAGMLGEMATRLAGSGDIFAASHRAASRGINYITAHDGFTLRDMVSYAHKHNEANGEQNRDGSDNNLSWNHGVEGATDDAAVNAARARDARALLATLIFARGTPMLTMGDESGRTQGGNNNAYAQDNALSWFDWHGIDADLLAAARRMLALRRATPALHQDRLLTGAACDAQGLPDVAWLRPDGVKMQDGDWQDPRAATLVAVLYAPPSRALLLLHAGWAATQVTPPAARPGYGWQLALDSAAPERADAVTPPIEVGARSVVLLLEAPVPGAARATAASDAAVRTLATQAGLALDWWDVGGHLHAASPETLRALLTTLRLPVGTEAEARDSLARLAATRDLRPLPASLTVDEGTPGKLRLGAGTGGRDRWLSIVPDDVDGAERTLKVAVDEGVASMAEAADGRRFTARDIGLPELPAGRYHLRLEGVADTTTLTVAPARCFLPPSLANGGRRWGVATHLYALRRDGDQGIGDFSALSELAAVAAAEGAAVLGLNPLHALFRQDRDRASPYHPADRRFLDPLYIDVAALGSLGEAPGVRAALQAAAPVFAALHALGSVDYPAVWRAKEQVLRAAFAALANDPATAAALETFIAAGGTALRDFTRWEAMCAAHPGDWHNWPAELRTPESEGVAAFAAAQASDVWFSAFLQFLAVRGLAAAADATRLAGVDIGLYRDLAVGCAPDGAEAWSEQARLLGGASVGAPPDPLGPLGQVWHLPPPDPLAMAADGYRSFGGLLAANMRHAGALRIDHVMGLTRLFLIPAGGAARDGTYLRYDVRDMMGQVRLESTRARCLVVGEDLGTVPPELGTALAASSILSYRVLWFEQRDRHFLPPGSWPARAAACVSTHDLPTLAGWWDGEDIAERVGLGLLDAAGQAAALADRAATKARLLEALRAENLLPAGDVDALPVAEIHALIARTPSALALVQVDDLTGERVGLNLPGTDRERPNWRRRLDAMAEVLRGSAVLAAVRHERPDGAPLAPLP
jgi:glycogen operon protein